LIDIAQLAKEIHTVYLAYNKADLTDKQKLDNINNYLYQWMQKICRRHPFFNLLIKTREISYDSVSEFIDLKFPNVDLYSKIIIFQEAVLAATNFILIYSNNELNIDDISNPEQLVRDSELLLFIAATARYNNFMLNTDARIKHADSMKLIESYNDRQSKNKAKISMPPDDNAILYLFSPLTLPAELRTLRIAKNGQSSSYNYKNYLPLAVDGQSVRERFAYLDCKAFSDVVGMPFDEFFKSWLLINRLLLINIPNWHREKIEIKSKRHEADLERLNLISRCGIEKGTMSGITEIHKALCNAWPHIANEERFFHQFIDYVTCDKLPEDEQHKDFVEKPYLFYRVGPDRLIWDVSRHAGFMNAIARKVLIHGGKAGNKKGANFEGMIARLLREKMPDIKSLKMNVVFFDETTKLKELEIDIGFVYNDVFYLIEAKSYRKSIGEYKGMQDKSVKMVGTLNKKLEKLERCRDRILTMWGDNVIDEIAFVVITEEVPFIPSFDPALWLIPGEVPRILTIDEFIKFLQ
jgi:hypothetical protein